MEQKRTENKQMLIIVAIVALLLILGVVWYYFSIEQAVDRDLTTTNINTAVNQEKPANANIVAWETRSWAIFTNSDYGYKLKYPRDWYFHNEITPAPPEQIKIVSAPEGDVAGGYSSLTVTQSEAGDAALEELEDITQLQNQGYTKGESLLDGYRAYVLTSSQDAASRTAVYFCALGGYVYRVELYSDNQEAHTENAEILETMISAFEFF